MKCPKCSYLGFETGDRCKNCGYDFSLLAVPQEAPDPDLNLPVPDHLSANADRSWIDRLHTAAEEVTEAHEMPEPTLAAEASHAMTLDPPVQARAETEFPLFEPRDEEDDEPLIKLPAAPRAPLSVRRTPEQPRVRPPSIRPESSPFALEFAEDAPGAPEPELRRSNEPAPVAARTVVPPGVQRRVVDEPSVSSLARRAAAGVTDHLILLGIDFVVLYSTLRMAGLTMSDWQLLPAVPMLGFLLLLKLSYFGAFTAACGQTIGKMAAQIRVIAEDAPLDPSRAIRRTLLSAVSLGAVGAGFIPALLDPEHRALHDRVARTRVVELPSH
jgi:uncharacterized RDD family membrane protein YckC